MRKLRVAGATSSFEYAMKVDYVRISTTVGEQPGPDTPQQSSNTSYKDANREFIGLHR